MERRPRKHSIFCLSRHVWDLIESQCRMTGWLAIQAEDVKMANLFIFTVDFEELMKRVRYLNSIEAKRFQIYRYFFNKLSCERAKTTNSQLQTDFKTKKTNCLISRKVINTFQRNFSRNCLISSEAVVFICTFDWFNDSLMENRTHFERHRKHRSALMGR